MNPTIDADFLIASPLLWLTLTLGAYLAATMVSRRFGKLPVLNPTLWSIDGCNQPLVAETHGWCDRGWSAPVGGAGAIVTVEVGDVTVTSPR